MSMASQNGGRQKRFGPLAPWRRYAEHVITGFFEISREHVDFERALMMKMHIEIAGLPEDSNRRRIWVNPRRLQ
jgi:hypothetical protein